MNEQQFNQLKAETGQCWKKFERYRIAHDKPEKRYRVWAKRVDWATLVLATLTGFAGIAHAGWGEGGSADETEAVQAALGFGLQHVSAIAVAVLGVFTTLASGIRQTIDPAGKAQSLRDSRLEISAMQQELASHIREVANRETPVDYTIFTRLLTLLEEKADPNAYDPELFKDVADGEWDESFVSVLALSPETDGVSAENGEMAEDAPSNDVQPMVRGGQS